MKTTENKLPHLLSSIRECDGLSQNEFSKKLCIDQGYLSQVESGTRNFSLKSAIRFAKILGYPPEKFARLAVQDNLKRLGIDAEVDIKLIKPRNS